MSTELRMRHAGLEFYDEDGAVDFIGDERVAKTFEEGERLVQALFAETDYETKYANTPANLDVLIRVSRKLNRHNPRPDAITRSRLLEAYKIADQAGGDCGECGKLERVPAPIAQTPRARDDPGRFQNRYLQELDAMLSNPNLPASAITARMSLDKNFREAVQAAGRVPAAPREHVSPETVERVRSFAAAYRTAPSLRFLSGYVTVGDKQYTRAEIDAAVEEAAKLKFL